MLGLIRRWLPPVSKDPEGARQESLLYLVIAGLSIFGLLFGIASGIHSLITGAPWDGFLIGILIQPVYAAALVIARMNHRRLATYLTVSSVFLAMVYGMIAFGLGHVTLIGFAIATLAVGILINTASGILFALLSMAVYIAMGILQKNGTIVPPNGLLPVDSIWLDAIGLGFGLAVLVTISAIYNREIRVSFQMESQLAEALKKEHQELSRRISENRQLLDQRVNQLRTLAEISMAAGAERRPLILLQSVVNTLHQRMNLSLACIYLLEEPGPQLVLRAATTEEAGNLANRGYRLAPESGSLAAQAVAEKHILLEGNRHLEKEEILSTGPSELAIPMLIGDRCLGVIDVQSKTPNAFDDSDSLSLRAISQTLAHGLEMARLNAQTLADQEEIRGLNRRYMADAWGDLDQMTSELSMSVESGGIAGEDVIRPLSTTATPSIVPSSITRSEDGSEVTAPLILREQVIGALTLETGKKEINQDDLTFIEAVTTQAALALENARLYSELTRRATYLQTANEIARDISTTLDLDLLLSRVVELIRERFGFSHAVIYLMDDLDQYAVAYAASGPSSQELIARRISHTPASHSVIGHALAIGSHYVARQIENDAYYQLDPLLADTQSELAIPLIVAGRITGVLDIHANKPNAFGEDEIAILQTLSGQLAVTVQNARLFTQVSQRAERERKVVDITSRIRSTNDISSILQTAVSELRRALGISSGTIMVGPIRPVKMEEPKSGTLTNA